MASAGFRERILRDLVSDLMGPSSEDEVLTDRPTQRYSTGIIYPTDTPIGVEENDDGGAPPVGGPEEANQGPEVPLHATLKPASFGLSFALEALGSDPPRAVVRITGGEYRLFAVDEDANPTEGEPQRRDRERWRRVPVDVSIPIEVVPGVKSVSLDQHGVPGLEFYMLVTPHQELLTVTAAVSNKRLRGDSRQYDESQHLFQARLSVSELEGGAAAPRPPRRVETDDDSRASALIYREVREYVVGHTCSAETVLDSTGRVVELATTWIPKAVVRDVSDRGDPVFEGLYEHPNLRPLDAGWLATAEPKEVGAAGRALVDAYEEWVEKEDLRARELSTDFREQAKKHVAQCRAGAERMRSGITMLEADQTAMRAFQLAQHAMAKQFAWQREGKDLVWRPFQLAFQLLVIESLATPTHPDREVLDLLWFPTGGGKTEAYLGLTAFIILLRRLRGDDTLQGSGVAVLMRYTLRLLTIQQFQRATAVICACEMLRRAEANDGAGVLGRSPIGIGLWVGRGATPLTLKEAVSRAPGDPSTPEQLTACPCCHGPLGWDITRQRSRVTCLDEDEDCEFALSGPELPVWTIDEEVYRQVPSLVIGTVDKFAQIVRKPEAGALFGGSAHSPPDLIIQDELHLISGPLGSMTGLYEAAIDELCRRDEVRPKIIGSTATIRRASDQARALFDRSTFQFPPPGLDAANSGFAIQDDGTPGRLYLGVTTAGRSATYMLQAIAASLLQSATRPSDASEEDFYWTLVGYFNSLRELGRALVLMQDDVPFSIQQIAARNGEAPRPVSAPAELTSRVPSHEIRDMLDLLGRRVGEEGSVDLLLASNMISVGMDIPRLGLMLVNAQPKSRAEYIQATSRVGRGGVPGLVVTMYNATRARDRSHYETFETWHRSLYRDVEATSVTPFASRAQDKALHAVLVALVRHLIPEMQNDPKLDVHRRAIVEGLASRLEARAARVDPDEMVKVSQKLDSLLDEWQARPDIQVYWDDYERRISLLMSAEQYAAKVEGVPAGDMEGLRQALWPTPNSMREVEAGTPYTLRNVIKVED